MPDRIQRPRPQVRSGALFVTLLLVLLLIALPSTTGLFMSSTAADTQWTELATHGPEEFQTGDLQNLEISEGGLVLGSDASFVSQDPSFSTFGIYTSPTIESGAPFGGVRLGYDASAPDGTSVLFEIRVRSAGKWSQWRELDGYGGSFSAPTLASAAQYRISLMARDKASTATVNSVSLYVQNAPEGSEEVQLQALATRPTVRLYATREGLVGRTTSNGHKIVERDRFVALPSKRALNPKDGRDYQVEITYQGKKATAPVWDVGPWNTKDDYWNTPRELFNDLPRFTPQVNAAFFDNYNNGNDQHGRPVIYPAAIDIADGTFWDDLGMKYSDWVDVTFLWVDAAAPPLVPMPRIVAKAGPIPQPIFGGNQSPAAAQPPAVPPTPTPLPKGWYFAEGSTKRPFDTWLLLQNPDPEPANVKITYMLPKGGQQIGNYVLKPTSRTSLFLNQITPDAEVSALVESDRDILAERAMYFNGEGHDTAGVISPSPNWFFAEGNTKPGYDTWILLQNPNTTPVTATLTFFKEDGSTVTHKMLIPHVSRESLLVNLVVPDALMGTRIEAERPIIAERAVYRGGRAGASSIGATALSKSWYMAEGNTRNDFDTWLLMMNPGDAAAEITVTFMPEEASAVTKKYTIGPRARLTVGVDKEVPNARVAAKVESTQPIVAERTIYFAEGTASHNSVASSALSTLWYLPEGSTAKPFTQYILLSNPGEQPANTTVTFMKEDGSSVEKKYTLRPASRFTIEVNAIVPDAAISTKVSSDQPIVAERSMYFNDWMAGHNAMGIPK